MFVCNHINLPIQIFAMKKKIFITNFWDEKSKHQYVFYQNLTLLYQKTQKQADALLHIVITWFYTQCIFTVKNEKQVTNDTKSIQISIQCKIITM